MITRKVTTYYAAVDGTEQDITVEVSKLDRFHVEVTGLDVVPESEIRGVTERATELYWAAARAEYLRSGEAERNGD